MGLKDLLRGGAPEDEAPPVVTPYTGEPYPKGTLGACPVPGELELTLPAGRVEIHYYCSGRPVGYSSGSSDNSHRWDLPTFQVSVKPADDVTQRIKKVRNPRMATPHVKRSGYSHKIALILDVPKPGGRYRAVIEPGVSISDNEAHVRFTD